MMHRHGTFASFRDQREDRLGWSAAMAGSLAVFVIALAVMIVMRAGWLDRALAASGGGAPAWVSAALAAGVLLGGISLLWLVLARFAREVEKAPYVWLAPVMTALPSIAIVAWGLAPPNGVSARLFAIAWVPLLIGGGSLFRLFGLGRKVLGFVLWVLPAGWVLIHASLEGGGSIPQGFRSLSQQSQMFGAVVVLTCLGVGALAFLTRDRSLDGRSLREERRRLAQERMSIAEERATLADERQGLDGLVARAEAALGGGVGPLDLGGDPAMLQRSKRVWPLALLPLLAAGLFLVWEFGHRRPMARQATAMQAMEKAHAMEVDGLRGKLGAHHLEGLKAAEAERDRAVEQRDALSEQVENLKKQLGADGRRPEVPGARGTTDVRSRKAAAGGQIADRTGKRVRGERSAPKAQAASARRSAKTEAAKVAARKARQQKTALTRKARRERAVAARKERAAARRAQQEKAAATRRARAATRRKQREEAANAKRIGNADLEESNDPLLGIELK